MTRHTATCNEPWLHRRSTLRQAIEPAEAVAAIVSYSPAWSGLVSSMAQISDDVTHYVSDSLRD